MKVGAYVRNPTLLWKLLRKIYEDKLPIKLLNELSNEVNIVITDVPEEVMNKDNIVALVVKDDEGIDKVVEEIKLLLKRKTAYNSLVIGIDPGKRIGVAVVGDGEFLEGKVLERKEKLVPYMLKVLEKYLYEKCIIRIGFKEHVSTTIAELIHRNIKPLHDKVVLELVSENKTSKTPLSHTKPEYKIPKDVASAIHIALKRGLRVEWRNA